MMIPMMIILADSMSEEQVINKMKEAIAAYERNSGGGGVNMSYSSTRY